MMLDDLGVKGPTLTDTEALHIRIETAKTLTITSVTRKKQKKSILVHSRI